MGLIKSRLPGPEGETIEIAFAPEEDISERVIFPITEYQSNGIEDARFVEFADGGVRTFYATFTAYSGRSIRSELIETKDFLSFRMQPLRGPPPATRAWVSKRRRLTRRILPLTR